MDVGEEREREGVEGRFASREGGGAPPEREVKGRKKIEKKKMGKANNGMKKRRVVGRERT